MKNSIKGHTWLYHGEHNGRPSILELKCIDHYKNIAGDVVVVEALTDADIDLFTIWDMTATLLNDNLRPPKGQKDYILEVVALGKGTHTSFCEYW